ncbi:hypothetical protein Hanom_Chr15g01353951 [Helianthus anomalus]
MGRVTHRLYRQPIWGLYTKCDLSPTRLVFCVEFSYLVCNIGIRARFGVVAWREPVMANVAVTNEARTGGLERASYDKHGCDQRERWPLRRVDCYGLIPL